KENYMRQASWILLSIVLFSGWLHAAQSLARVDGQIKSGFYKCDDTNTGFCPELSHQITYDGKYSGHDEPSLVFYSNRAGAGNNLVYHVTLPRDPIVAPRQDGTGGTFSFQLMLLSGSAWCCVIPSPIQTLPIPAFLIPTLISLTILIP